MILILGMLHYTVSILYTNGQFRFYNKTQYSGLEIHISNSYANSLLQVMHFTPLIRNMALQHAATACINELCLLCEMGFLFDMLEKAEGSICQATNLLKTFSNHAQGQSKYEML
jgi:PAB-dependent poly(A)-specific ribonuclease subunit 2